MCIVSIQKSPFNQNNSLINKIITSSHTQNRKAYVPGLSCEETYKST